MPSNSPRRLARLLVPLALAAGTGVGCGGAPGPGGAQAAASTGARRSDPPLVLVTPVERREMVRFLETTTTIESEREIQIMPRAGGIVASVLAEEGDVVAAGDVLCVMDQGEQELAVEEAAVALREAKNNAGQPELLVSEAKARVESTRLAYEQAKRDHDRDQRLFEGKDVASPVSQQTLEASRLAMDTAENDHEQAGIAERKAVLEGKSLDIARDRAAVALARAQYTLDEMTVRAPFDGVVAQRMVRVGQQAGPTDALFTLTDIECVRGVFYRNQDELALFRASNQESNGGGLKPIELEAKTDALPGLEFTGRVLRTSPTIDPDSGQFRVTVIFDDQEGDAAELLPGMLMRLRIATDRHPNALVVPKRAIRREGELSYVLAVEDDEVRRIDVEEGYDDDESIEVVPLGDAELSEGTLVIHVGSRDLEDGDEVRIEDGGSGSAGDEGEARSSEEEE
ncbi:MAG: efflux RND transporter periplasmic adaptor subunit [Planctomycetota bacterium]|nr:efflux RND transporter periplasmic adaptor subunit [Planctomycetota bacterium]